MKENISIRVPCQITWRSSLFPIGSWDEILIPIGPLFQLQFSRLIKAFWRSAEKCKKIYLFTKIYWSVDEIKFEIIRKSGRGHSARAMYSSFEEVSNQLLLFLLYVSTLTAGKS
jgi:hypothetical protein